jgi:hypothetical protein
MFMNFEDMNSSRRNFLKTAGMAAASTFALTVFESYAMAAETSAIKEFGIQLWTVRFDMEKIPKEFWNK